LLVPDFGVFRERTEGHEWCWRYDVASAPRDMATLMKRIRHQIEANKAPALPEQRRKETDARFVSAEAFYANEYLPGSSNTAPGA
jgi:hypothetical protein